MAKGIATVIGTDVALASQLQLQWWRMGNKEIEYINAIREVEEKWNSTEEELKMEMKELEKRMNHIHDQYCFTKQNIEMMEEEVG